MLTLGVALLAACGTPAGSDHPHWAAGNGAGGGLNPDGSGGPEPSASPSASPSPDNPFADRVPRFPAPPIAQPITVPDGPASPVYHRLPVNQPVAFLTIDDGLVQLPDAVTLMRAAGIPFSMFLIAPVAAKNAGFFRQLQAAGGVVEDHTIDHPELKGTSYAYQHHQICDAASTLTGTFGRRPSLFRPPYGDYDRTTQRVAHDCGFKVVLYWSETVVNGAVRYQTADHRIQPGDIILMHFRTTFVQDVLAALTAIHNAGLTPALLEDYLPGGDGTHADAGGGSPRFGPDMDATEPNSEPRMGRL